MTARGKLCHTIPYVTVTLFICTRVGETARVVVGFKITFMIFYKSFKNKM